MPTDVVAASQGGNSNRGFLVAKARDRVAA